MGRLNQNLERDSLLKLLWGLKLGLGFRIGSYKLTWPFNLYPTFAFISATESKFKLVISFRYSYSKF